MDLGAATFALLEAAQGIVECLTNINMLYAV